MESSKESTVRFWTALFNLADNMRDTAASLLDGREEWNLTIQQMRLLRVVYRKTKVSAPDGVMLKTIAESLNVTSAAVCGMVESMVKKGLLSRCRCETNRRSVNITLSDYSYKKISEMENFFTLLSGEVSGMVGDEDFLLLTEKVETVAKKFAEKHPGNFHSNL